MSRHLFLLSFWGLVVFPTFIITTPPHTVMRSILPAGCFLVLMVIMCGCMQSPPGVSVTPKDTGGVQVSLIPDTTATVHPVMAVNVTAEKTQGSVIIQLDGGRDAVSLTSLNVRITNYDGTIVQRTIPSPETGKPYEIAYRGYSNAAKINIVGTFSDGYQQTLLMTSL